MSRSRRMRINSDFAVQARHMKTWAHDFRLTAEPIFAKRAQTPLLVIGPGTGHPAEPVRMTLSREFHCQVTLATAIPNDGFAAVALRVTAKKDSCPKRGEAAKTIETVWAPFVEGRPIPNPREHATAVPCPACGHVAAPERKTEPAA